MRAQSFRTLFLAIAVAAVASACSVDHNINGSSGTPLAGVFQDAAAQGVGFSAGSIRGQTGPTGRFTYPNGGSVAFSIGSLNLGSTTGRPVLTPIELVAGAFDETHPGVIRMVRVLLTLDDDSNPANGIRILQSVTDAARLLEALTVATATDAAVQTAVTAASRPLVGGPRTLVTVAAAQTHFRNTLFGMLAANYSGTFAGTDSGTWTMTVAASGLVTGTVVERDGTRFVLQGQVTSSGELRADLLTGTVPTGGTYRGSISRIGNVQGTWQNPASADSGSFTGKKVVVVTRT